MSMMMIVGIASSSSAAVGDEDCGRQASFKCVNGIYTGTPDDDDADLYGNFGTGTWAEKYYAGQWAPGGHNCTRYVAYRLAKNGLPDPGATWGLAGDWTTDRPEGDYHAEVPRGSWNPYPAVGSVAEWSSYLGGNDGHVAYVEKVEIRDGVTWIFITQDGYSGWSAAEWISENDTARYPDHFIHLADQPTAPPVPLSNFSFSGVPATIVGSSRVDGQLQAVSALQTSDVTTTIQWLKDGEPRQTNGDLTLTQTDIGAAITAEIKFEKVGYATMTYESAPVTVTADTFSFYFTEVSISGTSKVEYDLQAVTSLVTPDVTTTIAWLKDDLPWKGNVGTVTLTSAEIGHDIKVQYTFEKTGYETSTYTSDPAHVVGYSLFSVSSAPAVISGTPKVEYTLTASSGVSGVGATYRIEWLTNGTDVRQAGGNTLLLTSTDIGDRISVRYIFDGKGYASTSYTSPQVTISGYSIYSFSGAPSAIYGTGKVEYTLSATSGITTPYVTSSILWFKNGVLRQTGGSTLLLTSSDIGSNITVRFTFNGQGYLATSYTSPAVYVNGYSSFSFSSPPATISGTARSGYTLTASSGLQTSGVTLTYNWYNNGVLRQTGGRTLLLKSTDVGDKITVRIYFDAKGYQATSALSTAVTVT